MASTRPFFLPLALSALTALAPGLAEAQLAGTQTGQLPNVLLLVDTSGSMERMNDGAMPVCEPGQQTAPNRWGSLVQALTGSFQPYFSCATVPRTSPEFTAQYSGAWNQGSPTGGDRPLDYGYVLPYNRPLTGGRDNLCGRFPNWLTPGALSDGDRGNDLAALGVKIENPLGFNQEACVFSQADDGQLDAARSFVRFGLMTFDSELSPAHDASGGWSYYRGSPAKGRLPECPLLDNEVGARSDRAPEWEGPLVPFPPADADAETVAQTNERIQRILSALRPFGATPLDGLMHDARDYLFDDPSGPSATDPYFPGCRDQYVILLTDGAPNLDLRPECAMSGGECPYTSTAKDVAYDLHSRGVPTFVIGFSVNGAPGVANAFPAPANSCSAWFEQASGTGDAPTRAAKFAEVCAQANPATGSAAHACCVLHEISMNGNREPALFAESQADLAEAFATIMARITKSASTRTTPVYSTALETNGDTSTFFAAFEPSATRPWSGSLDRQRLMCGTGGVRSQVEVEEEQGDRFGVNLSLQNDAGRRRFLLAVPHQSTGGIGDPTVSLRRADLQGDLTALDRSYGGRTFQEELYSGSILPALASSFLTPAMLGVTSQDCQRSIDRDGAIIPPLGVEACSKVVLGFTSAQQSGLSFSGEVAGQAIDYDFAKLRCPPGQACQPLGAIFRAEPAFSGPPVEPLRDDSYQVFATQQRKRPPVLYATTTDGLLHAFKTDARGASARFTEMWSFIPPAVLPQLRMSVPRGNQILLDGSPVVKDVVFERSRGDITFEQISNQKTQWHTALVAGFGVGVRGYYALDVTDPGPGVYDAQNATSDKEWQPTYLDNTTGIPNGVHFLWQLTTVEEEGAGPQRGALVGTDAFGKRRYSMFGMRTPKPALTTLFFTPEGQTQPREIAVAILAGGVDEGSVQSGSCPRRISSFARSEGPPVDMSPDQYSPRTSVRRWASSCDAAVPGRSVVVVRVDTGEIVRVFAPEEDVPSALMADGGRRVTPTPLDSPVSGVPVVYPGGLGTIGQKVIIGDADGTVWRFDLTSSDPSRWSGSLFFDTQGPTQAPPFGGTTSAENGQPIVVTPVAAANDRGELMVGIATGEQESFTPPRGTNNFVYSLTETVIGCPINKLVCTKINWYTPLLEGERVTGPMAIFDRVFYYATYAPARASGNVCRDGLAHLWGVDFMAPAVTDGLESGGLPRLARNDGLYDQRQEAGADLIPGVSIRQMPACSDLSLPEWGGPSPGQGAFSPGSYQLVIPRATAATAATTGNVKGTDANVQVRDLQTMSTPTRLDSFATIVE